MKQSTNLQFLFEIVYKIARNFTQTQGDKSGRDIWSITENIANISAKLIWSLVCIYIYIYLGWQGCHDVLSVHHTKLSLFKKWWLSSHWIMFTYWDESCWTPKENGQEFAFGEAIAREFLANLPRPPTKGTLDLAQNMLCKMLLTNVVIGSVAMSHRGEIQDFNSGSGSVATWILCQGVICPKIAAIEIMIIYATQKCALVTILWIMF